MRVLGAGGFQAPGQVSAFPPAREFLTSAGFGGAGAIVAAVIVAAVVLFAVRLGSRQHRMQLDDQERRHQELREDELHAAAVARCWQRLVWAVETASIEPAVSEGASLGLGPELALQLLRGLLRDAERLGDDTLAKAVSVYLGQFSLVLAQHGSLLSEFDAVPAAERMPLAGDVKVRDRSGQEASPEAVAGVGEDPPPATGKVLPDGDARGVEAERRRQRT
ncbi:MAG: hypothetical protein QOH91_4651 [Mycobacterium sp.]|jgi:hypothetical protein|nr:hypothetical protein [Mycobacterium sp.]